jgi:hypothetical protein
MKKNKLKPYIANATIFYSQEAFAEFKLLAENDEEALKKIREIIKGPGLSLDADTFTNEGVWFNVNGHFRLSRGEVMPQDDSDESILVLDESFENDR